MPNSRECPIRNVICSECPGECRMEVAIITGKNSLAAAFETNIPGEIISAAEDIRSKAASILPEDKFPGGADTVLRHVILTVAGEARQELKKANLKVLFRIKNL